MKVTAPTPDGSPPPSLSDLCRAAAVDAKPGVVTKLLHVDDAVRDAEAAGDDPNEIAELKQQRADYARYVARDMGITLTAGREHLIVRDIREALTPYGVAYAVGTAIENDEAPGRFDARVRQARYQRQAKKLARPRFRHVPYATVAEVAGAVDGVDERAATVRHLRDLRAIATPAQRRALRRRWLGLALSDAERVALHRLHDQARTAGVM